MSRSWLLGLVALHAVLGCGPGSEDETVGVSEAALTNVFTIQGSALTSTSRTFDPGIFSINSTTKAISRWCIASGGAWLKPYQTTPQACATNAQNQVVLPDQTFAYLASPEDVPKVSVKNLGVDNARWATARADVSDPNVPPSDPLKMVGSAVGLNNLSTGLRWSFNASKLPTDIRSDIPGSGINIQVGKRLSQAQERTVFTATGGGLQLDTNLNLLFFARSAPSAFSGITAAVNLITLDTTGVRQPITLIVSLFNPNGLSTEYLGNDGRNPFVSSVLKPGTVYVTATANQQKTTAWNAWQNFGFQVTRANMQRLLSDVNAQRQSQGLTLLSTDLTKVKFKEATIRNESRFVFSANVQVTLDVSSLSVSVL